MICRLCGSVKWLRVKQYHKPDPYEAYIGIDIPVCRRWYRCLSCGLYSSFRTYGLEKLTPIYTNGYRDPAFRGESIEQSFNRITSLPSDQSENLHRVRWFHPHVKGKQLLDIGSGFGVFPYVMKLHGNYVETVEPNKDAAIFIRHHLGMKCHNGFFHEVAPKVGNWQTVSCIHVLEHMEEPETFLEAVKFVMNQDAVLFLEVPNALEFEYLPDDHDEFNSTHVHMYDVPTLYRLLQICGFEVEDLHCVRYKQRNLSRIMAVAHAR